MERRLLQLAVLVAGLVPVLAGAAGILLGSAMAGPAAEISVDSHFRYLSGLLLGIGLVFWWMVPHIERHTALVRVLTVLVAMGGVGRLYGILTQGVPDAPMLGGLVMELVVTPLLCVWQSRVGRETR